MARYDFGDPIETARLRLRPYTSADFEPLFAMRSDAESVRYLYFGQQAEDEVRATLARKIAGTSVGAQGDVLHLAAELLETGEFVADVILCWVSEEHSLGEIGYSVHPAHAGRGYATEATRPLLRVAFEGLGLHRVMGRLEARNAASARVLEKLGLRLEAHLVENEWVKDEWQSELVYAILDREWQERASGSE